MIPKQILEAALDRVTEKRILAYFRDQLRSREQRQKVIEDINEELQSGLRDVLETLARGKFPEISELLSKLTVALHRSRWGVYLRIAFPLVSGLPILLYVGSSCCMTVPVGGMSKRAYRHLYRMSSLEKA